SSTVLLVKTNAYGDTLWTKTFENGNYGDNMLDLTYDGGFIIAGTVYDTLIESGINLIRTNSNGDTLWTKIYAAGSSNSRTEGPIVRQTSDSGFIVAGTSLLLDSAQG